MFAKRDFLLVFEIFFKKIFFSYNKKILTFFIFLLFFTVTYLQKEVLPLSDQQYLKNIQSDESGGYSQPPQVTYLIRLNNFSEVSDLDLRIFSLFYLHNCIACLLYTSDAADDTDVV